MTKILSPLLLVFLYSLTFLSTLSAQTYNYPSSCGLALDIPDVGCGNNNSLDYEIVVDDLPAGSQLGTNVFLAEVRVIIEHTFTDDIEIRLTSPMGNTLLLSADNGSGEDNYGDPSIGDCSVYTTFTASSCEAIVDASAPFLGIYAPQESFSKLLDNTDPSGTWILQVCDDVEDDFGTLEFVELIFAPQECLQPLDVAVVNVDSTTVVLDWFSAAFCEDVVVEYGPVGFTPGVGANAGTEGTLAMGACPPYALENLGANTTYDLYLRHNCGATFSANSCVVSATTLCELAPPTLRESFNNQNVCSQDCNMMCLISGDWTNDVSADFDWLINTGSTATSNTGPTTDADGDGKYIYIETSGANCRNGNEAYLTSSCIEVGLDGKADCHFSFQYHMFGGSIDSLLFQVSEDSGGSWVTLWGERGNQGNQWLKQYINLATYDGQVVKFRFLGRGGTGNKGDIAIDNLVFYGSQILSSSGTVYYADIDGDTYGDPSNFLEICTDLIPTGYVLNADDCNDTDANINPDAMEIGCNNIDENCNGLDDDLDLAAPLVASVEVCSGEMATLIATLVEGDYLFWYDALEEGNILFPDFGTGYMFDPPANLTDAPQVYTFYAEAKQSINFMCASQPRTVGTITVYPSPDLEVLSQGEICTGQSINLTTINVVDNHNTNATISYHSALPPTSNNELTDLVVSPEETTTYYLFANSPHGCTDIDSIVVETIPGADISIQQGDSSNICLGGQDTLYLDFVADPATLSIEWNTGDTTDFLPIVSNNEIGVVSRYLVEVTNEEGCVSTDFIYVTTVVSVDSVSTDVVDVMTCEGSDGTINLRPQNGIAPFHYQWEGTRSGNADNIDGDYMIQNLPKGTYNVTVTDSSPEACPKVINNLVVNSPDAEVTIAELRNVSCNSENDGMIALEIQGNNPSIEWNTGATTDTINELVADTYFVSVTDNNCQTVLSIVVEEPTAITVNPTVTSPRCSNTTDASIELEVQGGATPFTYLWNTTDTTRNLENISAGNYQVQIKDANDCLVDAPSITITAPDSIDIMTDDVRDISCFGKTDGRILVSVTGGNEPYTYEWNNAAVTEDLNSLGAGDYTLVVRDSQNCVTNAAYTITDPPELIIALADRQNATCAGANDGALYLNISGGTVVNSGYDILWANTNNETDSLTNIPAGDYRVLVNDDNNCFIDTTFQITAPEAVSVSATVMEPHCQGATDGQIELFLAQPAQSYLWSTGDTTRILNGVTTGDYNVSIVDNFGCSFDTTITVRGAQIFSFSAFPKDPKCFGETNGAINLTVLEGGRPPFNYEWNTGQNTKDLQDLPAGIYYNTVRDADNCIYVTDTFHLEEPPVLLAEVENISDLSCFGDSSGSIELSVSGGRTPYKYFWNDEESTSPNLFDLSAGVYQLLVVDAGDCTEEQTIDLIEPSELKADYRIIAADICDNVNQKVDSIQLLLNGGTQPYKYEWMNGEMTRNLTDVTTGDYEVTITDAKNCQTILDNIKVSNIPEPFRVDSIIVKDIACFGDADGSLTVQLAGGNPPYQYLWSPPLGGAVHTSMDGILNTGAILNRSELGYNVTVTDANNCRLVSDMITLNEPTMVTAEVMQDSIQNVSCYLGFDGKAVVDVRGGVAPYSYSWFNQTTGEEVDTTFNPQQLFAGEYVLLVNDANHCPAIDTVYIEITEPLSLPDLASLEIQDVLCFNGSSGEIDIEMIGGTPPYRYEWSNGQVTQDINELNAGAYSLRVEDNAGCAYLRNDITITQPDSFLILSQIVVRDVTCFAGNDGRIIQHVQGGTSPYSYYVNDVPSQTSVRSGLIAGTYDVAVTDVNGCPTATEQVEVLEPDPIMIAMDIINASSSESMDGAAMVTPLNGVAPFEYDWNTGDTTASISEQLPGDYQVLVTDATNCQLDTTATISFVSDLNNPAWDYINGINFYPNPVRTTTYLEIDLKEKVDLGIKIYSSTGQVLLKDEFVADITTIYTIPVQMLPSGIYFIILEYDNAAFYSEKLIIAK